MITVAAIKTADGRIWSIFRPGRHPHLMNIMAEMWGLDDDFDPELPKYKPRWERWVAYKLGWDSGFLDDKGNYLTRDEALEHIRAIRQPKMLHIRDDQNNNHKIESMEFSWDMIGQRIKGVNNYGEEVEGRVLEIIGGVLTSEDLW
jgi:hypothetical protein